MRMFAACADPNIAPRQLESGQSKTLIMGGNLRTVTERDRPIPVDDALPTVCSKPSPDVPVAFDRTLALSAAVNQPGGVSRNGTLNAGSTESKPAAGETNPPVAAPGGNSTPQKSGAK